MKYILLLFAVLSPFIQYSTGFIVPYTRNACRIHPNSRSITIHNLKTNCNMRQIQRIFSNLSAGTYPNGRLKGHTLFGLDAIIERIWNGKNFYYTNGTPHDHGTVTNSVLGIVEFIRATIYRTIAPLDGREAFAIDYKNEILSFLTIDYVRQVQRNLWIGCVTIRGFENIPIIYFLLERV